MSNHMTPQFWEQFIGLRGLADDNRRLEKRGKELLTQERSRMRINRKSKFGCTVMIEGGLLDCQLKDKSAKTAIGANCIGVSLGRESDLSRLGLELCP
jgi:hypothetical protein